LDSEIVTSQYPQVVFRFYFNLKSHVLWAMPVFGGIKWMMNID